MAYECQGFVNGQVLTAECLNKMDEALADVCGKNDGCQTEVQQLASDLDVVESDVSALQTKIGDIDTALDTILAKQASVLGG